MKRLFLICSLLAVSFCCLTMAQAAMAQENVLNFVENQGPGVVVPAPTMTPEIWMYLQDLRRYDDPAQAVRRNAAERSAERRSRLAAQRWYGYSNSRPHANITPFSYEYSPRWTGNSTNENHWIGPLRR